MSASPGGPGSARSAVEFALRHLGTRDHGDLVGLIEHAIVRPSSATGATLAPLVAPTAVLENWSAADRAAAVWQVIQQGIQDPDVSPTRQSRRRRALQAAFRLPDEDIEESWGSSLTERFKQLRALKSVFNQPTSTQPMEMAWSRGVRLLAAYVEDRLTELRTPSDWESYRSLGTAGRHGVSPEQGYVYIDPETGVQAVFRKPSSGAQPVFVNLFVTTVFMRKRSVYRRITERLITAQANGVEYYTARGFAGRSPRLTYVPVQALWGCRAEFIEAPRPGRPAVTRLWFPAPLNEGEQAHLVSEVIDENVTDERHWVDVDIDHHGIAPGRLAYGNRLPISGLTIRIRFDEDCLPESVWWYAELNERERYDQPPAGDPHLLQAGGVDVQHTFTDQLCQPRESYGIAFSWPSTTT
jgi:hypothetical protein